MNCGSASAEVDGIGRREVHSFGSVVSQTCAVVDPPPPPAPTSPNPPPTACRHQPQHIQMTSWLALDNNALSVSLPTELGNLVNMYKVLNLEGNRLSSAIPTQLGTLASSHPLANFRR